MDRATKVNDLVDLLLSISDLKHLTETKFGKDSGQAETNKVFYDSSVIRIKQLLVDL